MASIAPENWKPVGIRDLEPAAWQALRHSGSACVVAGPGAGKTEFLAQKACYLLETGLCPEPKRILAIAFKTDAAANLRKRVGQRVPEHARRFQSLTFDAYTKGLVDRFKASLPEHWRPRHGYALEPSIGYQRRVGDYLNELVGRTAAFRHEVAAIRPNSFLPEVLGSFRLPAEPEEPSGADEFAIHSWWDDLYVNATTQTVEFTMLNRLAELVVRSNPQIQRALRLTYPFIFLDEFQDTTFAQYDFLKSVFGHPSSTITAVGDGKQSIMRWAGAMHDTFHELHHDLGAKVFPLRMNYRSSEALVEIQHVIARALDDSTIQPVSGNDETIDGHVSQIWRFDSEAEEARKVSDWIAYDINRSDRTPSDYALLGRQKTEDFEGRFADELGRHGIAVRNDSLRIGRTTLQDLLVDETSVLFLNLIRLAATRRNPTVWTQTCTSMTAVRGVDIFDDMASRLVSDEVSALVQELRQRLGSHSPSTETADALADLLFERVGRDALKRTFVSYRTTGVFAIAENAFRERLAEAAESSSDWIEASDRFQGVNAVPLMTVHKSKGLEYHTVIFLGIDDSQWWAHRRGQFDGLATFFVGLSRAAQRAMFTFCSERGERQKVDDLYSLLQQAGVTETRL